MQREVMRTAYRSGRWVQECKISEYFVVFNASSEFKIPHKMHICRQYPEMFLTSWNAISNLFWSFRGDVGKVVPAVVRKGSLFRVGGSGGRWNGYPNQGHYPWFRSGWNFTRLFGCTSFTVFHLLGVISISSGNIQFEQQTEMYNKGWIFTSIGHRYLK